jgi:hypothetical protein
LCVVADCPLEGSAAQQSRIVRMKKELRFKVSTSCVRARPKERVIAQCSGYTGGESEVFVRKQNVIAITETRDRTHGLEVGEIVKMS